MSYILEAIRRSEEERRRRLVPGVATIHAAPSPRPLFGGWTGPAVVLAGGLALAAGTVIALQAWPWPRPAELAIASAEPGNGVSPPTDEIPAEQIRLEADAEPALPPPAVAPQPRPADTPGPPEARASDETAIAATAKAVGAPADGTTGADAEASPAASEKKPDRGQPRRPYSAPAAGGAPPAPPQPRWALGPDPALPTGASADGIGIRQEPSPPPVAEMVSAMAVDDLPASLQRALPDIAITLHRFADRPGARMIRVNGRIAREGDVVAGGLSVAEITRTGAVFTIDDERFYMDAFQVWQGRSGS